MNKPTELYSLIKSLTQAEKRYIKIQASLQVKGDKKNYIALFDAIDNAKDYDESRLLKDYPNASFSKHFRFAKHYLYNLILRNLRNYNYNNNIEIELYNTLIDLRILFNKGLYNKCIKTTQKAFATALKYEYYEVCNILCRWERRIIGITNKRNEESSKRIHLLTGEFATRLKNLSRLRFIEDETAWKSNKIGEPRTDQELAWVSELADDEVLESTELDSFYEKEFYFFLKSKFAFFRKDIKDYYHWSLKSCELWDEYPHMIQQNNTKYIVCLSKLISATMILKDSKYEEYLLKMEGLLSSKLISKHNHIYVENYVLRFKLIDSAERLHFEESDQLIDAVKAHLTKHLPRIKAIDVLALRINVAKLSFYKGDYKNSIDWLNAIINQHISDIRNDILSFSEVLLIVNHYELENYQLINGIIKSKIDRLKKLEKLHKFERVLLNSFRKELPKVFTKKELLKMFQDLNERILQECSAQEIYEINQFFELNTWVKSKVEQRPFITMLKEKKKG